MAEKLGILGRKLGMTRVFDEDGGAVPVTVIQAGPCPVLQVKNEERDGYNAVQIAFAPTKEKHVTKPLQGHFKKADRGLFRNLREIRLENPAEYKVGDDLTVDIFHPGDLVKVTGQSIGKGTAGAMKRWGFKGGRSSHGAEKAHRKVGSIGAHTEPSRVWRGQKMAGHMGDKRITTINLKVIAIRPEDNVLLIKGAIPGPKNGLVIVRKQ